MELWDSLKRSGYEIVCLLQIMWPSIEVVSNEKGRCMHCRHVVAQLGFWRPGRVITINLKLIFKRSTHISLFPSICLNNLKFVDRKKFFFLFKLLSLPQNLRSHHSTPTTLARSSDTSMCVIKYYLSGNIESGVGQQKCVCVCSLLKNKGPKVDYAERGFSMFTSFHVVSNSTQSLVCLRMF